MNRIVQFPSITYAQKALKALEGAGVKCRLSRRSTRGCGYSVVVPSAELENAFQVLKRASIPYSV